MNWKSRFCNICQSKYPETRFITKILTLMGDWRIFRSENICDQKCDESVTSSMTGENNIDVLIWKCNYYVNNHYKNYLWTTSIASIKNKEDRETESCVPSYMNSPVTISQLSTFNLKSHICLLTSKRRPVEHLNPNTSPSEKTMRIPRSCEKFLIINENRN
jgi:hypothetical protein